MAAGFPVGRPIIEKNVLVMQAPTILELAASYKGVTEWQKNTFTTESAIFSEKLSGEKHAPTE